jgi:hypothetical protein
MPFQQNVSVNRHDQFYSVTETQGPLQANRSVGNIARVESGKLRLDMCTTFWLENLEEIGHMRQSIIFKLFLTG